VTEEETPQIPDPVDVEPADSPFPLPPLDTVERGARRPDVETRDEP
jgi:hypothetical protein